jgi:hypothetical protein
MEYVDKTLHCSDCGLDFIFDAGEQEFFASKGFENEPGRCPECRASRKQNRFGNNGGLPVPLVAKTARYPSSPEMGDRYTALTATPL